MAVFQHILITICAIIAVTSAVGSKIENNKLERPTKFEVAECPSHNVGKPIFHENPSKLWICVAEDMPLEMQCDDGSGFNGSQCVPWSEYPCNGGSTPMCQGKQITRPHKNQDPRKFWICKGEGEPEEYSCPEGFGFMDAPGDLGCVPWARWRCLKMDDE